MARVSRCSTCWASETPFLVASFWSQKYCSRNFSNSVSTVWNTRRPVSGYASTTWTMRLISFSSASPTWAELSNPITQAPMRSIRRRAGWSVVAKKSGSDTATRNTGICSRANHTRTAAGMRSSVRMLWNSSATISMVARSSGVAAAFFRACLRWCRSSSIAGVVTCMARWVVAEKRRRTPVCAESMACARPGDSAVWPAARRLSEVRQVAAHQPVQAQQHRLGMLAAARQAGQHASSGAFPRPLRCHGRCARSRR